jgi:hypothetical protein
MEMSRRTDTLPVLTEAAFRALRGDGTHLFIKIFLKKLCGKLNFTKICQILAIGSGSNPLGNFEMDPIDKM